MRMTPRDVLGGFLIAALSAMLFVLFMGSLVLAGYGGGAEVANARARALGLDGPADHVPVLCYHYVGDDGGPLRFLKVLGYVVLSLPVLEDTEVWTVRRSTFESHMRFLYENGYSTVTLDDVAAWREGRLELPPRSVAITFDDGDRSVYENAWPVLRQYGFTATFFVVTGRVGEKWEGVDGLSWNELREMKESGTFDIQSHTHDMHFRVEARRGHVPVFLAASTGEHEFSDYGSWEDALLDDLGTSRVLIRQNTGDEPRYLAWPYGEGSEAVDRMAARAGFTAVVSMLDETNRRLDHPTGETLPEFERLQLNRYPITARTSLRDLREMLRGQRGAPDA